MISWIIFPLSSSLSVQSAWQFVAALFFHAAWSRAHLIVTLSEVIKKSTHVAHLTYLCVDVDWVCGRSINLEHGLSIFGDLTNERNRVADVVILIRHFYVKETDGLFRRRADGLACLKVSPSRLKVVLVAGRVEILLEKNVIE